MNLSLLFKIQGVVLIVNGLGSLFLGSIWIALGTGWEATPDLITFGQFTGVVLFVVGVVKAGNVMSCFEFWGTSGALCGGPITS